MREYGFELVGTMALLMHSDNIEAADELDAWRKDPANKNSSRAGDDRSPAWTWQTYLYHDGEHVVMPQENIMVALRQGGAQMILKKQKTYKEISQSGLMISSEYCDFLCNGKKIPLSKLPARDVPYNKQAEWAEKNGFCLFAKRAKIGTSKHIRIRPRFDSWSVRGRVQVVAPEITEDVLQQLFTLAGRGGLCDWRPACKTPGPFGMFEAKLTK